MKDKTSLQIFLFVPNLLDYFRLFLIILSWYYIDEYSKFLPLYIFNIILDGMDGWLARKLNQVSDYGASLDVILDLIGRGMTWCFISKYGYAVIALEWLVYVGNNERANGKQWKTSFDEAPFFVRWVMDKGYKTPMGVIAITGLHVLPPWLYIIKMNVFLGSYRARNLYLITNFLICSRIVCATVEMWCLWKYLLFLLHKSPNKLPNHVSK